MARTSDVSHDDFMAMLHVQGLSQTTANPLSNAQAAARLGMQLPTFQSTKSKKIGEQIAGGYKWPYENKRGRKSRKPVNTVNYNATILARLTQAGKVALGELADEASA